MCWLQNMSLLKESIPRDWEWEQEGKRTKTNRLNQVLISIFGLVWSIFRYKHLMIWFSNLGCSALRKRGFAIPTSNGEKEQGGKKTPRNHRLRSEQWLCCRTSHKLQRGLRTIHSRAKSAGIDTGGDLRTLDWAGHIPSTTGQLSPTDTCTHRARRRKERCRYWRGGWRRQSVPLSISKARQTLGTNHGNCTRI